MFKILTDRPYIPAQQLITGLVLDGSFRLPASALQDEEGKTLVLDPYKDPQLPRAGGGGPTDFVTLLSPEAIKAMMRAGYRYAKQMHERGELGMLQPIAKDRFGHEEMVHWPRSAAAEAVDAVARGSETGIETIYGGGEEQAAAAKAAGSVADAVREAADRAAEGFMEITSAGGEEDEGEGEEQQLRARL